MEHILFHLIVETIQAIDRKMQRPLRKAVPELERLRSEPRQYLKSTPVTFGPRKRRVLATVIGVFIGLVVVGVMIYIFSKMPKQQKGDPSRIAGLLVSFIVVAFVARSVALRLLRGGSTTLRLEGVEFTQGGKSMFMPWDLLRTAGTMFEADHKSVVLPINPTIPVAIGNEDDQVAATMPDDLDTPFAQFDDGQMSLKDLYDVRVAELGGLLFELGQQLGVARTALEQAWAEVPPLAVPDEKGWVRIQLTQLPFPPICAGCGESTHEVFPIRIAATRNRSMTLALPFCRACAAAKKRRYMVAIALGIGIGLIAGVMMTIVLPNVWRRPMLAVIVGVVSGIAFGFLASLIGGFIAFAKSMPVQIKDYQPNKATVKLKFVRPQKSAGLLEALGIPTEKSAT